MKDRILEHYDALAVRRLLDEVGVLSHLRQRGFSHFEVFTDVPDYGLPHIRLFADKQKQRFLLLDACLIEAVVRPAFLRARGHPADGPVRLALLYWVREEDPTATFSAERPPLPLQKHPGLGVMRRAFQVVTRMAREQGMDGVACTPKFFHDAVLFFRSRLFLFLDWNEQGRLEALIRDLQNLSLGVASIALSAGAVRDQAGAVVPWSPGYQVFPISETLIDYFHSERYAAEVGDSLQHCRLTCDGEALARARALVESATAEVP